MKFHLAALTALAAITSSTADDDECTLQHVIYRSATTGGTHREEARCSFGNDAPVLISGGQRHEDTQAYFLSGFKNGDFVAGASTMSYDKDFTLDTRGGTLSLNKDTIMGENFRVNTPTFQARALTGENKTLVVRVNTGGGAKSPPTSLSAMSNYWFGTNGDLINNDSQFQACSFGKVSFPPYVGTTTTGVTITDGAYEITVSATYNGSDSAIEAEARTVLEAELGSLGQFDYVAIHVPGEGQGYCAYAYINNWFSLYQDNCGDYVTVQMHEIGHNLGLAHSGEGSSTYGDTSGVMGAMWDDNRNVCFNGAKSGAQLGWYDDRIVDVNDGYDGDLYGIASYGTTQSTDKMLLKMNSGSTDYWVSYNSAIGVNSEPGEGANQVLVHSRSAGSGYAESTLLAKLGVGSSYSTPVQQVTFVSAGEFTAYVVVGAAPPTPTPDCTDFDGWTDSYGDACYWYEANDGEGCPSYGDFWANPDTGVTPGEACCWCGGGNDNTAPTSAAPVAVPTTSPTFAPTESNGDTCSPIIDTKTCNQTEGCAYNKFDSLCKAALSTEECSAFDGKKRKCKKNGCKYKKNSQLCKGRWD